MEYYVERYLTLYRSIRCTKHFINVLVIVKHIGRVLANVDRDYAEGKIEIVKYNKVKRKFDDLFSMCIDEIEGQIIDN
jgi:hypothetical protein